MGCCASSNIRGPSDVAAEVSWGQWMGAWKAEAGAVDEEQERLSRQHAAFGADTGARMKDINVLILGCRGVGVETAKNLILSNVGSVSVWDETPASVLDLGSNFYLQPSDVGKSRASQCVGSLRGLNPYCKVEVLSTAAERLPAALECANVLATGRGYSAVVVTTPLPRATLVAMDEAARSRGMAFLVALNSGVTASVFSDFGPKHVITDENGEPNQMLAISNVEVMKVGGIVKIADSKDGEDLLVLTLASDHNLEDGATVVLDDMRGDLSCFNGKRLKVKRFVFVSPQSVQLDLKSTDTKELLKNSTVEIMRNFSKMHDSAKADFSKSGKEGKFPTREITLFNRLVLVLEQGQRLNHWTGYQSGGLVSSVKPIMNMNYDSFEKTLARTPNPQMMDQEAWMAGEGCWIQLAIGTALKFYDEQRRWPGFLNEADAGKFVSIAKSLSEQQRKLEDGCWLQKIEFTCASGEPIADMAAMEKTLHNYSLLFEAELTGMCAFLGGLIAQEVIKLTGKFRPIDQWIHHYDPALLVDGPLKAINKYQNTRYCYQATVIGENNMESVRQQNVFLVGVGALGCEYAKGIALMGGCTAPGSKLILTDMDRIEVSNLSRQFLFRQADVGSAKSTTAARVVKAWNPDLKIEALEKGVGDTSEDTFDDAFWSRLSLCWNALDNVKARQYTDRCCLWYGLPLLESGTLGTKTNSDVFLPKLTQSYNDAAEDDSNETQIAMCTLRSFPYLPLHCIEFAKQAYFSDYMEFAPQQYEAFRQDPNGFFEQLDGIDSEAEKVKALKMIKEFIEIQSRGKLTFDTCIRQAFKHFVNDFITSIRDLVHQCDQIEKAKGIPFWTGTKRRPKEASWDPEKVPDNALEYLYACANCYAFIFKVPYVRNRSVFEKLVRDAGLKMPDWIPPAEGAKVESEEEADEASKVDPMLLTNLQGELRQVKVSGLQACSAHDFEKDDDSNFHIDFLTVCTNLRAANYDIKLSERATVKVTAGRIIPALATTTAMVCGLVDNEFLKLAMGLHKGENGADKFYNANINLATGKEAINAFRPDPPIKRETKLKALPEYTSWDKVEIRGELSVQDLVKQLEESYGCVVRRIAPACCEKVCIFDAIDVKKQQWVIAIENGKPVIRPDDVFAAWPQLRMAAQMLERLPETSGQRKMFETQIHTAAKSLEAVKSTFAARMRGPVSRAYAEVMRPTEDGEKLEYFNTIFGRRPYLALAADVETMDGEPAELPVIRYTFRNG